MECRYKAVQYNVTLHSFITAVTDEEYKSKFGAPKYTPYLTLTDKLLGAFCEDLEENWPRNNDTALCVD